MSYCHACMTSTTISFKTTLQVLPSFAIHCPQLRTLGVQVDADSIPCGPAWDQLPPEVYDELDVDSQLGASPSALQNLYLGCSPLSEAERAQKMVAHFLSAVFPKATLQRQYLLEGELQLRWYKVTEWIDMIRGVKIDERQNSGLRL
ncbi:hypothetical protein C8Q74DRAFT_1452401 [Fomes fomentarius]|nr:hypothetical protein C8Q74DRAFT_1452401 [Fomes fomentarius]